MTSTEQLDGRSGEWEDWQRDAIIHGGNVSGLTLMDRLRILILGRFSFRTVLAVEAVQGRVRGTTTFTIPGLLDRFKPPPGGAIEMAPVSEENPAK